MIELKDIVVKFGDFEALHNINVNVKEGEFFTFLGPSGCCLLYTSPSPRDA